MPDWAPFVGLGIGALILLWRLREAIVVFEVRAEKGRVTRARGRIPPELLRELEDVLGRARATGRVEARLDAGRVAAVTRGLDDGTAQRVRNVLGRFPAARVKSAKRL